MSDEKKDIEVVEGTGNLDISPVYDHLSGSKPKMQDEKPKNIVIPKVKKPIKKEEDSNEDEDFSTDIDDLDEIFNGDLEDIDSDLTDDIDKTDD